LLRGRPSGETKTQHPQASAADLDPQPAVPTKTQ